MCWIVFEGSRCPECGYILEKKREKAREPEQKKGTLKIINKEEIKERVKNASTLKEFHEIAKAAGYKPGFAYYKWLKKRSNKC